MEKIEEKISVLEFLKKYDVRTSSKIKEEYVNSTIKVKEYLGFEIKLALVEQIIKASCYDENGRYKVNSSIRYILYMANLVTNWTNLDMFADQNVITSYNELCKRGIFSDILDKIPEEEVTEFQAIMDMKMADIEREENSIKNVFRSVVEEGTGLVKQVFEYLSENEEFVESVKEITKTMNGNEKNEMS